MAASGCGVKRNSRWSDAESKGLRKLGVSGRDGGSSAAQALDEGGQRFKCEMEEARRLRRRLRRRCVHARVGHFDNSIR